MIKFEIFIFICFKLQSFNLNMFECFKVVYISYQKNGVGKQLVMFGLKINTFELFYWLDISEIMPADRPNNWVKVNILDLCLKLEKLVILEPLYRFSWNCPWSEWSKWDIFDAIQHLNYSQNPFIIYIRFFWNCVS